MIRAIYVVCIISLLASCTQRAICPAFQSAFIYDKHELRKKFSYFQNDTVPKVLTASKNKYLVAEPTTYQKRVRNLQTVSMKNVYVNVPDSISGVNKGDSVITAELDAAARSVIDSIFIVDVPQKDTLQQKEDSIYVITKDKEVRVLKYNMPDSLVYDSITQRYIPQTPSYYVNDVRYNTEQDNYMWYLRHSLILPDVRLAKMQAGRASEEVGEKKEKKGFFGFFKNLFKKKKKEEIDSAELALPPNGEEQFDYVDTLAQQPPQLDETNEKKSVYSGKKRKEDTESIDVVETPADKPAKRKKRKKDKKVKMEEPKLEPEPEKKKVDEDDGF
jgi:hypothetical protein